MRRTTKLISLVLAVMLVLSCFTGLTAITASAEDETPDVYSVFGSSAAIFGDVWFAANPATEMTLDETDGLYKITFEDVEPTEMLQFKVLKNHNEDFSWGAPGTDQNYTVNIEQTCDLTITFDPVQEIVNAIGDYVVVPQGLQIDNVIAVGNGEDTYLNGANWDPCDPSNAMMELEPGVWAITMEDIYAFDNYNIKFAGNSIDGDQNPVANPWGINWGAAAEQLYPTEQWIPAVYNGKNAIFEVEDDESVVRIILDLRSFNFVTKEGARFKIQINPGEDAPYDDTTEPTTVAPTTAEPDPEPTTVEPDPEPTTAEPDPEPTTAAPTTKPVDPDAKTLTVKTTSNLFTTAQRTYRSDSEGGIPDTVTVVYYADVDTMFRLQSIQAQIEYDTSVLTFDPAKNGEFDEDYQEYDVSGILPVAAGLGDVNIDDPGVIKFAVAKWDGMRLKKNGELIPIFKAVFDVAPGASGTTTVNNTVAACAFCDPKTETDYIVYNVNGLQQEGYNAVVGDTGDIGCYVDEPSDEEVPTDAPTTAQPEPEPTTTEPVPEPTTEASTTVTPTNPDPGDGLTVNAISNVWSSSSKTYPGTPETVTVTYFADLSVSTLRLQNIQFSVKYDPSVLSIDSAKNAVWDEDEEAYDYSQTFPVASGSGDTNFDDYTDMVKFAVSKWDGLRLSKNGELIPIAQIVFDVAPGATGSTDVIMEFGVVTFVNSKTEEEYIVHSTAGGLNQENYEYITSIGEFRTVVDDEIEILPAKAPTCTETGLTEGKRNTVTGEIIVPQNVIPALGHAVVTDPAVPVTCTVDGKTEGSHCSRCNEVLVAQQVIPAQGHKNVSVSKVEPTCTEPGHTAGLKCSVCGITIMGITTIPAKGHTPVNDPAVAATCTEPGHTAGTHCSTCNEILSGNEPIEALGHDVITKPGRPATYTQTGLTDGQFCNRCKKWIVQQQVIPKLVTENKIGDINRDGYIDVLDAIAAQKFAAEKASLDDEQMYIGDVNNDGNVDVLDAILIQKYSAEKISEFPKKS